MHKTKNTSTATATACNTVLNIQELQDMIRSYLTIEDLKTCTLVCHRWNSHFDPFLWQGIAIWRKARKYILLKRHGTHVRRISCHYFDKSIIRAILRFCPNIETLYLRLDHDSMWISYMLLEELFIHLQDCLTNVHILFDARYFEPGFLWSLTRLRRLKKLFVEPHSLENHDPTFDQPGYYKSFLECCPTLRHLVFQYGPYFGGELDVDSSFKRWARKIIDPRRQERLPVSPQDAISRMRPKVKQGGKKTTTVQQMISTESLLSPRIRGLNPRKYNLRSLQLQPPAMDLPTFLEIIRQSPSLEMVELGGQWSNFHPEIMFTELSTHCPRLRQIDIQFSGPIKDFPTIATLITLFPRLEALLLMRQMFTSDPDLSTLDSCLKKHQQQYGVPHPFKSLEITGTIRHQFPIVIDALTLPAAMTSVKINNIIRHSRFALGDNMLQTPPLPERTMRAVTTSWPCQNSLTVLDISSVIFPDCSSTFQFFGQLQECSRLQTLHMWLFHLRDMMSHIASRMIASGDYVPLLNNTVINSINIDISSSSSSSVGSSQTSLSTSSIFSSNYNSSNHIVQSLTLSFPTVQKVYVAPVFEMLRSGLGPGITMTEARLLIASMPVLTDLGLISSAGCVEVNLLQQEYPYLKIQQ